MFLRTVTVIRSRGRLSLLVRCLCAVFQSLKKGVSSDTDSLVALLLTYFVQAFHPKHNTVETCELITANHRWQSTARLLVDESMQIEVEDQNYGHVAPTSTKSLLSTTTGSSNADSDIPRQELQLVQAMQQQQQTMLLGGNKVGMRHISKLVLRTQHVSMSKPHTIVLQLLKPFLNHRLTCSMSFWDLSVRGHSFESAYNRMTRWQNMP